MEGQAGQVEISRDLRAIKYESGSWRNVAPGWNVKRPKDDSEYFERMTKSLFTAGLNWTVIEKKWPNFQKAFAAFSLGKVARLSEKDVKALMNDAGIVRNEKKIRATVHNAGEFLKL